MQDRRGHRQGSEGMIHNLKSYPAMKDSGVPWLGAVPEHWRVERLKSSMTNVIEQAAQRQSDDMYVALEHVESWTGLVRPADSGVAFDSQVKRFRAGDILFGKLRPYLAKVTRPTSDGVCVGEFLVLRPRRPDGFAPYLEQLLRSKPVIDSVNSSTFGAKMPRADWQFVGGMPIPLPPLPEQAAIVRFLDYADRRIRRYIFAKQKLIKLLEEQKQAIIHRAVTRGLDPNVRLKPSGVEWLGDVPEHWDVTQIRSIARVVRGGSPRPAGSPLYFHGTDAPWITVGEITRTPGMFLTGTSTRLTPAGAALSRTIEPDTLLLTNSGATLGVPKISLIRGCINDGVAAFLNLRPTINTKFLYHYLSTQTVHLKAWVDLGAQPNLNTQIIGGWPVLLPPIDQQSAIVEHIAAATVELTAAADHIMKELALLREYRTRLIADVVTGKLDVRGAAARLPEDARDIELLDEVDAEVDGEESTEQVEAVVEETEA
jgi:type I restriction enzyme S subunit